MAVQPSKYTIKVRDNNLNLIGEVDQYQKFLCALNFNNYGTWELTLDASHPMAPYLSTRGYGIVVVRNGATLLSGPMNMPHRKYDAQGDNLVVSGFTDEIWLAKRDAWPVTNYPYDPTIIAEAGLVRFYEMRDASGTTCVDHSASAINGTYTNGVTLNATSLIDNDNAATAASFASASSQYVTAPITGMPSGNSAFSMEAWINATTFPSSQSFICGFGKDAAKSGVSLFCDTSGNVHAGWDGGNVTSSNTITTGTDHHVAATYDGTTYKLYVDSVQVGSATPGTLTIASASAEVTIGTFPITHGTFWNGVIQDVAFYSVALTGTQISNHYDQGVSRFAASAYDTYPTSGTTEASTVMQHYVDVNLGPSAVANRQVSTLTLASDPNLIPGYSYTARFDDLITKDFNGLLQSIANAAGLGFKIVQSGTNLEWSVFQPTDRSAYAIFSPELGNLVSFDYAFVGPDVEQGGNYLVIGGAGDGTARTFYLISDSGSITDWGRSEGFYAQTNTSNLAQLAQTAADQLLKGEETVTYTATLQATEALEFMVSTSTGSNVFNLGDTVTIVIDGTAYSNTVREVDITVDAQGGEVITPLVGTPTAHQLRFGLDNYARILKSTTRAVRQIQRAQ